MVNQKLKGKVGELELAKYLTAMGIPAERGVQYSGKGAKDVNVAIKGIHVECKRQEKLRLREAINQAAVDCDPDEVPVVCHRSSRTEWLITLHLANLPRLAELIYLHLCSEGSDD